MSDNSIEIHDDLTIDYYKPEHEPDKESSLYIEGEHGYIFVDISHWQALKEAGDKLITENKDG